MEKLFSTLLSVAAYAQATCDDELGKKAQEAMVSAMIEVPGSTAANTLREHARALRTPHATGSLVSEDLRRES